MKLAVNPKYCDMGALNDTENNKFPSTKMEYIYPQAPRNTNELVSILTNIIFRETPKIINDTLQVLGNTLNHHIFIAEHQIHILRHMVIGWKPSLPKQDLR